MKCLVLSVRSGHMENITGRFVLTYDASVYTQGTAAEIADLQERKFWDSVDAHNGQLYSEMFPEKIKCHDVSFMEEKRKEGSLYRVFLTRRDS